MCGPGLSCLPKHQEPGSFPGLLAVNDPGTCRPTTSDPSLDDLSFGITPVIGQ